MVKRFNQGWLLAAIVALAAAGCTTSVGNSATPVVMQGVMLKGSVILNGVHFDIPPGTSITVDGAPGSDVDLNDGMVVTLRGTINGDGTGTLEKLATQDELQGQVQSVNAAAGTLQVLDQTIFVDDQTKYSGLPNGLSDLVANVSYVEVHGLRDAAGNIRASRIRLLPGVPEIELKGVISALTATTFQIGALVVTYTGATIDPSGTTLANGMRVEVKLSGSSATLVRIEDLTEDPDLKPIDGTEAKIEGYVTGFTATPGSFQVNGQSVETTASTEFKNGSSADLTNDIRVEVEGMVSGGVLVASEVKFERVQVRIEGSVTAFDAGTLTVFGLTVHKTPYTEGVWPAATGSYRVKAYVDQSGSILAEQVESGGGQTILQAPVQAEVGSPTFSMTLLGITADLSAASFAGDNHTSMTRDQFFAAVTPGAGVTGTLIAVKGAYSAGTIAATEAEIED